MATALEIRHAFSPEDEMKQRDLLTVLSLIAIVLTTMHVADDYVHGFDRNVVDNPYGILIFVVWSSGVLLIRDRVLGRVIMLLGGVVAVAMPILHLRGRGYGEEFLKTDGALRFIWTLYILGTVGALIILGTVREMASRRSRVTVEPDQNH
jgi:hypothetical protein